MLPVLTRTTGPATEPVTLAEAKAHCRIDHDAENSLITALIVTAREYVEAATDQALITQDWTLTLSRFPAAGCPISLPKKPLQSVLSVSYRDTDNQVQSLDPADLIIVGQQLFYAYDELWPAIGNWPGPVTIDFRAGFGDDGSAVPQTLKQAMLIMIAHWYENREAAAPVNLSRIPWSADALIDIHRPWSL